MRLAFALLMILHGLIHFLGFIKGFKIYDISQLNQSISKSMGMLWLLVTILFLISTILYLYKKDWWVFMAFLAIGISQTLIIIYWKDTKFGTIANAIILVIGLSSFGHYQFERMMAKEINLVFSNIKVDNSLITEKDLEGLPQIVQKWLLQAGVLGKGRMLSVKLQQIGKMRTKPESNWMPFKATQYFNVENSDFVWTTEVDAMFGLNMIGRDKLVNGKGSMLIKVANIIPVVNENDNEKINSGAMIRFLAEICWFPSAALNENISWEPIDAATVKATLKTNGESVSGIFKFNSKEEVVSFEADRYFGGSNNAQLEKWVITMEDYKIFNGVKIPYKCHVTWKLKKGDFDWLHLEIIDLEYNVIGLMLHNT